MANIVSRSLRLLTSARTARLPAPSVSLAACSDPAFKPQMATRAPSLSNSCAAARPIPLLPPVMRMFLFASLSIVVIPSDGTGSAIARPHGRASRNNVWCHSWLAPSLVDGFSSDDRRSAGRAFERARRRKVPRKRPGGYGDGEAGHGDEPPGQPLMREEIGGRSTTRHGDEARDAECLTHGAERRGHRGA